MHEYPKTKNELEKLIYYLEDYRKEFLENELELIVEHLTDAYGTDDQGNLPDEIMTKIEDESIYFTLNAGKDWWETYRFSQ